MKNDLSIVIVTWNSSDTIVRCINSIEFFTTEAQIIIVDSFSHDETINKIINLQQKYKNIKLVALKKNVGFSKANNIGGKYIKNDNVLFLNPDAFLIEQGIDYLTSYLSDTIGIVTCRFIGEDNQSQPVCFNFDTPINILLEQFAVGNVLPNFMRYYFTPYLSRQDKIISPDWVVGAFLLMKTKDFSAISGFSEDYFLYSEDMDICYKIHEVGKKVLYVPDYEIIHLGGQSEKQDLKISKSRKLIDSKFIFANKYHKRHNEKTLYFSYLLKYIICRLIGSNKSMRYKEIYQYIGHKINRININE